MSNLKHFCGVVGRIESLNILQFGQGFRLRSESSEKKEIFDILEAAYAPPSTDWDEI